MQATETLGVETTEKGVRPRSRNQGDRFFKWVTTAFALVILAIAALIVYSLAAAAVPAVQRFGIGFLFSRDWNPVSNEYGSLPFAYGTLVSSLLALIIAAPVSVGVAAFLTELAPRWLRAPVGFLVELLAAVPSVIYGLWGIFVLVPWLRQTVQPALIDRLGVIPLFEGPAYGLGMSAAALILAVMITPTIASLSRDIMAAVPRNQKEALLALGATRWEVIRTVVLPQARSGILGATVLGLGRALGETMAVVMVIGNNPDINLSIFAPAATMASIITNEFNEATGLRRSVLLEIGLLLFLVSLVLNVGARLLVWRVSRRAVGNRAGA